MMWHAMCQQGVTTIDQPQNINFNKIAFIDWFKFFIMAKHVFYDFSYVIIMSNTIKKTTNNVLTTINQLHETNFNKIFID